MGDDSFLWKFFAFFGGDESFFWGGGDLIFHVLFLCSLQVLY